MRIQRVSLAVALLGGGVLEAQTPARVTELRLRSEPPGARVRPLESIAVQVQAFGSAADDSAGRAGLPLQHGHAAFHLSDTGAGWLSKPYRFQKRGGAPLRSAPLDDLPARLADMARELTLQQDTVLFTASNREGEVVLTASVGSATSSLRIVVDSATPSTLVEETTSFGPEPRPEDPYRPLVEHYAPFVAQETWFQPKSDYLARFDADGDWRGDNNWRNAPESSTQAYVYYGVIESETHWFLIYNFFHLRDYSDKCIAGSCHENDNEGLILTVAKDGSAAGRPVAMETIAHNKIYSYRADPRVSDRLHDLEGEVEFVRGSHPAVFVQSGGHGVYGVGGYASYSLAEDRFAAGTGVTYLYKGLAERPRHPAHREVGYELLPIYQHWWVPAHERRGERGRMFSGYFRYRPYGGRPLAAYPTLAGAFFGRKHAANRAKPFWGWHDGRSRKRRVLATGQWALDPAYSVSRNLALPQPFSLRYVYNPYLRAESGGASVPLPDSAASR